MLALIAVLGAVGVGGQRSENPCAGTTGAPATAGEPAGAGTSVAVPSSTWAGRPGMATSPTACREILNSLANVTGLKVAGRTSLLVF
jgi:hypothetical protein